MRIFDMKRPFPLLALATAKLAEAQVAQNSGDAFTASVPASAELASAR
jgi:hypothetical protein